jgi:BioD-like phosphotransacetylase family protein
MLVTHDTFAAMELLEQSASHLSPQDEIKVHRFTEMMDQDGALERLLHSLGILAR